MYQALLCHQTLSLWKRFAAFLQLPCLDMDRIICVNPSILHILAVSGCEFHSPSCRPSPGVVPHPDQCFTEIKCDAIVFPVFFSNNEAL